MFVSCLVGADLLDVCLHLSLTSRQLKLMAAGQKVTELWTETSCGLTFVPLSQLEGDVGSDPPRRLSSTNGCSGPYLQRLECFQVLSKVEEKVKMQRGGGVKHAIEQNAKTIRRGEKKPKTQAGKAE